MELPRPLANGLALSAGSAQGRNIVLRPRWYQPLGGIAMGLGVGIAVMSIPRVSAASLIVAGSLVMLGFAYGRLLRRSRWGDPRSLYSLKVRGDEVRIWTLSNRRYKAQLAAVRADLTGAVPLLLVPRKDGIDEQICLEGRDVPALLASLGIDCVEEATRMTIPTA